MLRRPSPTLSSLIARWVDEQPADEGWPIKQGRDRGALLVHSGPAFVWYLTPEGKVLVLDIDDFQQRVVDESNEGWSVNAVAQAARERPQLAELLPERPPTARACPHCRGTGDERLGSCACHGLGWLP